MNILTIGGSGHVSGAIARTALAQGHAVWTITRGKRPLPEDVVSLIAERHDNDAMEAAVTGQDMETASSNFPFSSGLPAVRKASRRKPNRPRRTLTCS